MPWRDINSNQSKRKIRVGEINIQVGEEQYKRFLSNMGK